MMWQRVDGRRDDWNNTPLGTVERLRRRRWRGAHSLAAALVLLLSGSGVAYGLFTSAGTGTGAVVTGQIDVGGVATTSCTIEHVQPGDSTSGFVPTPTGQTDPPFAPCTFTVTNNSTIATYVGVTLTSGGTGLYDGTSSGLNYQVSDGVTTLSTSGALNDAGGTPTQPLLLSTVPDAPGSGAVHVLTVNWSLPSDANSSYAGLDTTLTISVQAVQSSSNGSVSGCTAGHQCPGVGLWGP